MNILWTDVLLLYFLAFIVRSANLSLIARERSELRLGIFTNVTSNSFVGQGNDRLQYDGM